MSEIDQKELFDKILYPEQCRSLKDDLLACLREIKGLEEGVRLAESPRGQLSISCAGSGIWWDVSSSFGNGYIEYISIEDRYLLTIQNVEFLAPVQYRFSDSPLIGLGIRASDSSTTGNSLIFSDDSLGTCFVGGETEEYTWTAEKDGDLSRVNVTLLMPLEALSAPWGMQLPTLAAEIDDTLLQLSTQPAYYQHFAATEAAMKTLHDMAHSHFTHRLRYEYMLAKTHELLCHFEHVCIINNEEQPRHSYRLTANDVRALEKAKAIMQGRFNTGITAEEVARDVGLSVSRFRALFSQQYGYSVHKYMLDVKLHQASKLLLNTDMPISEIASLVGYSSLSSFRDAFRKTFNKTPREFRSLG